MADFLDEKRKEIQARLKELKPLVEEYQLLQAADQALGGLSNGATAPRRRRRPRPARRARAAARPAAAPAPAAAGRRAAARAPPQALELVATAPASPSRSSPRRWASSRTTSTA